MKYLTIITLILLIHVSAAVVNAIQYTAGWSIQPYEEGFSEIEQESIENMNYLQSVATTDTTISFGFGDFVVGFLRFVGILAWGIVAVPYTLTKFGLDATLAVSFSIPVYFMYLLGIAQFIANRSTKGMT